MIHGHLSYTQFSTTLTDTTRQGTDFLGRSGDKKAIALWQRL